MKSGYSIKWTNTALNDLRSTFDYLEMNFTEREILTLTKEIERMLKLISKNPRLFVVSKKTGVRKVPILKFNTMYYWVVNKSTVEILSFYSNRQKVSFFSH